MNPRHKPNLGTIYVYHPDYILGDIDAEEKLAKLIRSSPYYRKGWEDTERHCAGADAHADKRTSRKSLALWHRYRYDYLDDHLLDLETPSGLVKAVRKCRDIISMPVYLYNYECRELHLSRPLYHWDMNMVGCMFISRAEAREHFNVQRLTRVYTKAIEEAFSTELELYNLYLFKPELSA